MISTQVLEVENGQTMQAKNEGQEETSVMARTTREVHLDPVVRPDQTEGLQPFTTTVMGAVMSESRMLPAIEKYSGATDLDEHMQSFVDGMTVYSSNDVVWGRFFFFFFYL